MFSCQCILFKVIVLVNIFKEICQLTGHFRRNFEVIRVIEKSTYKITFLFQNILHFEQNRRYVLFKKESMVKQKIKK